MWTFLNVIIKVAPVPLGIARRAIDEVITLAPDKLSIPGFQYVSDEVRTHDALARAEALVSSARAFVHDAVGQLWESARAGDPPSLQQRAMVRLAMHHAATSSRDAVQLLYDTMTTSSVYQPSVLDQAMRDVQTICQHVVLTSRTRIAAGRALLGLDPNDPTFL